MVTVQIRATTLPEVAECLGECARTLRQELAAGHEPACGCVLCRAVPHIELAEAMLDLAGQPRTKGGAE